VPPPGAIVQQRARYLGRTTLAPAGLIPHSLENARTGGDGELATGQSAQGRLPVLLGRNKGGGPARYITGEDDTVIAPQ